MKKTYKVFSILMIMAIVLCSVSNVFAAISIADMDSTVSTSAETKITEVGNTIFSMLTSVGIVLSVVVLVVLGIKYMMGSTEEKAEYKKTMMPYLVGAVLIFGASSIATLVIDFGDSL